MRKLLITIALLVGISLLSQPVLAEMTSTNFIIRWDAVNSGGSDTGSSATYKLHDSVGDTAPGSGTSTTYGLDAGYRAGIYEQVITFDVMAQSNATERVATSLAGTTIVTDTTGLSVGDFIAIVQDRGPNQVAGMGKINAVGVGTVTVDELEDNGTAPTIDGTNDYVYE